MVRAAAIAAASVTRRKSRDNSRSVLTSGAIICLLFAQKKSLRSVRFECVEENGDIVSEERFVFPSSSRETLWASWSCVRFIGELWVRSYASRWSRLNLCFDSEG